MKRIVWTGPAKADVRSLSKPSAMHILSALHRFAECPDRETIEVLRVRHRGEAYR